MGTVFRDQFTALGPHVNLAARICSKAAPSQILVSQSTEARISDRVKLNLVSQIKDVKNIPGSFDLYSLEN
jgi:class 3 adenylate cyclase